MIHSNKRNPFPPPLVILLFPAFAARAVLSNLRTLLICSLTKDSNRVRRLDRTVKGGGERVPLVATFHPVLNNLGKVARKLHPMLTNSEEHRDVFPEPPLIAFRRCKNFKDILVRARLGLGSIVREMGD